MLLRPIITQFFPRFYFVPFQEFNNPVGGCRKKTRQPYHHSPDIDWMESVSILRRVDGLNDPVFGNMFRQRQLNNETVNVIVLIKPGDMTEQFIFGGIVAKPDKS